MIQLGELTNRLSVTKNPKRLYILFCETKFWADWHSYGIVLLWSARIGFRTTGRKDSSLLLLARYLTCQISRTVIRNVRRAVRPSKHDISSIITPQCAFFAACRQAICTLFYCSSSNKHASFQGHYKCNKTIHLVASLLADWCIMAQSPQLKKWLLTSCFHKSKPLQLHPPTRWPQIGNIRQRIQQTGSGWRRSTGSGV